MRNSECGMSGWASRSERPRIAIPHSALRTPHSLPRRSVTSGWRVLGRPSDALARRLAQLAPEDLVSLMVEGALEEAGPIARALNEAGYALPPLPNLFFTRDVGIVIGAHSIIGSMRYGVRWTEELLIKALFRYHEKLENAGILYDGSEEKRSNYTLEGGPHFLRGDAGRGSAARADLLRGQQPHAAGARAVGERLQLLRRATGSRDRLRAERGHGVRARARRVQGRERGAPALGRRRGEGGGAGRDHDRGQRAGARRRRAAGHDAAPAARRRLNGLAAGSPSSLSGRALAYLEAGPASSLVLAREVLGLARAPRAIAERVATTLVGADPRVSRLPDGRWTLAAPAAASPGLDACRFAVVDVETTGTSPRGGDRIIEIAVAVLEGDRVAPAFQSLVNPGVAIAPFVARLTGIDDTAVCEAPSFAAVADRLLDHLAGTVFVAHNVRFDWTFLLVELERARSLVLQGPRLCTLRLP